MADDDTVRSLNRRIEELSAENATLRGESKDRRIKGKRQGDELEQLRRDHEATVKDRDSWKVKAEASHPDLVRQVAELQGTIRLGKHQAVFHQKAEAAGIDPRTPAGKQALADLWTLSGYKAEAEEPDAAAIDAAIAGAKAARPYLFGQAAIEKPADPTTPPSRLTVPLDPSRGGGNLAPTVFRVTSDNLRDITWMQLNAPKIQAHREAGTLAFE